MYEVKSDRYIPENALAGEFPVTKDVGVVEDGTTVRKLAPVAFVDGNIVEAAAENLENLCGIAADHSENESVVYYTTGEFFAGALELPEGVTVDALKPLFRKLSIFLK